MAYTVKKLPLGSRAYDFSKGFDPNTAWPELETACIDKFPWFNDYPQKFESFAKVGWNEEGLSVLMYSYEAPLRAAACGWNGRPCEDSCLEFFFIPFPETDNRYFNFEVNPVGAVCAQIGAGRPNRQRFTEPLDGMTVHTSIFEGLWAVSYNIPMELIKEHCGKVLEPGSLMRGNFYKCAERLHEHYGVWNNVVAAKPDFHRPECFGEIVIE